MKVTRVSFPLLLLCAALLCACSKQQSAFTSRNAPHHFKELKTVETLLETDPSSAADSLVALRELAANTPFTPLDANELLLREVQAQFKNRSLSEQSPDLLPVIAFYDSLAEQYPDDAELQFLRANTYYYKGVEYAYLQEDVMAFTHYLRALGLMKSFEAREESSQESRFIALTYTRLSEILYRYGLFEPAIESCKEASSHYSSDADLAAMMRFEAAIYQAQKDYDKALARFQEAEQKVSVGEGMIQLSLGVKLIELQQYDSAVPYLKRAFSTGDRFARVDAASKLAEIYRDNGNTDEELYYTRYYVDNTMGETRLASKKMEIEYLYDDFNHPKNLETTENEAQKSPIFWLSLLFIALCFMTYIIVRNRKRIKHIESKISTIELKHEQENAVKDQEIEQIAQQLSDTREQLENVAKIDFDVAWKSFSESPIVKKIKQSVEGKDIMIKSVGVYPKLKLKEMDYIELVREANRCFPDFSSRFLKDFPDLNVADLRHSCLVLLGLNDAEIAVLEGISYSGTNRRTKKILVAIGQGNHLEQALIAYLNNSY
jgi:tetratricopeptide (TPR) repeat protein